MSLILEALRKLERDKDAPERGFVVMAHVPWAQGGSRSRLVGIGALALALAVGALAVTLLWRGRNPRPAGPEAAGVAAVAPSVAPRPAPVSPAPFEAKALAIESLRTAPRSATAPTAAATPIVEPAQRPQPSPASEIRLNAISQQDGKPVAILNDRLVREGDVFDGIHVIRIGEAEVEIEVRGQRKVLTF